VDAFHNEIIHTGQVIFFRGDEMMMFIILDLKIIFINNTFPKTKKYNCINNDCLISHDNPSLKWLYFYKQQNSYNIRYV
jgi:hypothetical protein